MTLSKTLTGALSLCLLGVALVGCSGAAKKYDTYTSPSGNVTILESDSEACVRSCNADFDRCSSTSAAESQVGRGQMTGVFGAQADCKDDMKSCLRACKTPR